MSVSANSRNNHTAVVRVMNRGKQVEYDHLDVRQPVLYGQNDPGDREFVPVVTDNWSRIAWRTLGSGQLWWVIADVTGVIDPFTEILPRKRIRYVAKLTAQLSTGVQNSITVDRPTRMEKGQVYRIDDLTPGATANYDVAVLSVNDDTGEVLFTPQNIATAIPAALSRISRVSRESPSLVVPSVHRAIFDAQDFSNSLLTLVE